MTQLDPLTTSDLLQLQVKFSNMLKTSLEEFKSRLDYVELLTKIFSDNESVYKVRKKNDAGWAKLDSNEKGQ